MNKKPQRVDNRLKVRYSGLKAIIDRFLAMVGILVLLPLLAFIAISIVIDSPGGAIFRQERIGKNGKKFIMYKFRSMRGRTNNDDYRQLLQNLVKGNEPHVFYKLTFQPRVTKVGALLRETNLDELPQLFNVLKGDLHLIGPRPDIPYAVDFYEEWMRKRLLVAPGMTGLWQVSGGNNLSFSEMVRLDIEYIERQSIVLDASILWKTVGLVLARKGKYWKQESKEGERSKYQVKESGNIGI